MLTWRPSDTQRNAVHKDSKFDKTLKPMLQNLLGGSHTWLGSWELQCRSCVFIALGLTSYHSQ